MKENEQKNHNQGFTLLELLVVVLIIGILAAIALPQYKKAVIKSRYATLKSITRSLAEAEEMYYLANGRYTKNMEELVVETPIPTSTDEGSTSTDYNFDWGLCRLAARPGADAFVKCRNNSIKMDYQINFDNSVTGAGKVLCVVVIGYSADTLQGQVCKQETGDTSPTEKSTYSSWVY